MTDNSTRSSKTINVYQKDPYKVTTQLLDDSGASISCFFFHSGANFYVFSYQNEGGKNHTFIDTGDPAYRDDIRSILRNHDIDIGRIEYIIITHRHHDHCGLTDILAGESDTKVLVHQNFKEFVTQSPDDIDREWLRGFDPSRLQNSNMVYLSPSGKHPPVQIYDTAFPFLGDRLQIGNAGHLEILTCPESDTMHSPDQLIVRYVPEKVFSGIKTGHAPVRPGDVILFSGDLWLMHGPLFSSGFRQLSRNIRMAYNQMRGVIRGKRPPRRDPRLQDTQAKEALKRGFSLIQVMPGHGEDFLGTRMLPSCFFADRDLLMELGYDMFEKKSILRSNTLSNKISAIREKAFAAFVKEVELWQEFGYTIHEISDLLVRIYQEQTGGGPLVSEDREERRQQIKLTLHRLGMTDSKHNSLKTLAETTLSKLENIS